MEERKNAIIETIEETIVANVVLLILENLETVIATNITTACDQAFANTHKDNNKIIAEVYDKNIGNQVFLENMTKAVVNRLMDYSRKSVKEAMIKNIEQFLGRQIIEMEQVEEVIIRCEKQCAKIFEYAVKKNFSNSSNDIVEIEGPDFCQLTSDIKERLKPDAIISKIIKDLNKAINKVKDSKGIEEVINIIEGTEVMKRIKENIMDNVKRNIVKHTEDFAVVESVLKIVMDYVRKRNFIKKIERKVGKTVVKAVTENRLKTFEGVTEKAKEMAIADVQRATTDAIFEKIKKHIKKLNNAQQHL